MSFTDSPVYFLAKHIFNPPYIYKDQKYQPILKTQIHPQLSLFMDRHLEFADYFKYSLADILQILHQNGTPNTPSYREKHMQAFDAAITSNAKLAQTYAKVARLYTYRLMLAYERYTLFAPYRHYFEETYKRDQKITSLDYGCGVADISLTLAVENRARPHLVDLDDDKFAFTQHRFTKRQLDFEAHPLSTVTAMPKISKNSIDLIIATEVLEHVPDPLKLIQNFHHWLKPKGILFNSMGTIFERKAGGDHLPQAMKIGNSSQYKKTYQKLFKQIRVSGAKDSWFFLKQ